MLSKAALVFGVALACGAVASTASADVQITMRDGRVSIVAKDATLRQILAEWAKVGQTRILNGDRVPGGPLTLQLNNVSEMQALDTLLRTVTGYVALPRAEVVSNLSRFDRIAIMPAPAPTMSASAMAAPPPPAFPPAFQQRPMVDDQDVPVFNQFPPPQVVNPGQNFVPQGFTPAPGPTVQPPAAPPAAAPAGSYPGGSAVPGMIVAPPQPKKPGGGQ